MDKLPRGWKYKMLSEVGAIVTGNTPPKNDASFYENGTIPFVKPPDLGKGIVLTTNEKITIKALTKSRLIPKNSIMVCCIGSLGKIGISGTDLITNQQINSIVLNPELVDFKYGYYYSLTLEKYMNETANKAIVAIINKSTFSKYKIPLPPLKSEQTRIVSKLDALFACIDKSITLLEENLKHTKGLMASVLEEVFRDAESKWNYKSLKSTTSKIGSGSTPRGGQDSYKTYGMSLIRSMNIHDGEFRHKGLALIDDEQATKLANVAVEKDDVLLNITGASVARCSIVDASILPARVNQHVSIIRPTSVLNPYFLQAFLISPNTKSKLLSDSGGGATREAITKSMIENLEVPVPDIKIQKNIINYIQKIKEANFKIILEQQSKLAYLKALKSSILDRAFKGEL